MSHWLARLRRLVVALFARRPQTPSLRRRGQLGMDYLEDRNLPAIDLSRFQGLILLPMSTADLGSVGQQPEPPPPALADTEAPVITIGEPLSGLLTSQNLRVQGTVVDASGTAAFLQARVDGGEFFDVPLAGGHFDLLTTFTLDGSEDGAHLIEFVARDSAGNISAPKAVTIHLDTYAPNIQAGRLNDSGASATDGVTRDPAVAGAVTDASRVVSLRVRLDDNGFIEAINDLGSAGTFTFNANRLQQFNDGPLSDGAHTLTLEARDELGQTSQTQLDFTLDTSGPVLTADTDLLTSAPVIRGGVTDLGSAVTSLEGRLDGGTPVNLLSQRNADGKFTLTQAEIEQLFQDGSPLEDGTHTVSLEAHDEHGNASGVAVDFFLDTTGPELSLALVSDTGASSDRLTREVALKGSADGAAHLRARLDAGSFSDLTADMTDGHFTLGSARLQQLNGKQPLADGPHTLTVWAEDEHGNATETGLSFTLDTAGPEMMATVSGTTDPLITGSVREQPSALTQFQGQFDGGTAVNLLGQLGAGGSFTLKQEDLRQLFHGGSPLPDGDHTLTLKAVDEHGNTTSITLHFTLDTTQPGVQVELVDDTGAAGDHLTSMAAVRGAVSAHVAVTAFQARLDGDDFIDLRSRLRTDGAFALTQSELEQLFLGGSSLPEGPHTLEFQVQDEHLKSAETTLTFTLDAAPPILTAGLTDDTGASASDWLTRDATVTGKVSDARSAVTNFQGRLDGGNAVNLLGRVAADGSFTLTRVDLQQLFLKEATLQNGPHLLTLRAEDEHGHASETDMSFTLDTGGPALTVALATDTGLSNSDGLTQTAAVNGSVSDQRSALSSLRARLDGGTFHDITSAVGAGGTFTLGAEQLQQLNDGQPLGKGPHTLTLQAQDEHGNSTATSLSFTLDGTGPDLRVRLATDTGASASDRLTRDPTLTGKVSDDLSAVTQFEGSLDSGNLINLLGQRGTDGSFTLTGTELAQLFQGGNAFAEGAHTLLLQARDEHGNAASTSINFRLDTTAPALQIGLTSDTGSSHSDRLTSVPTVRGTVTDASSAVTTVRARLDRGNWGAVVANAQGAFTLDAAQLHQFNGGQPLPDGAHTLTVQTQDEHGNPSETTLTFTLDTTGPAVQAALASDTEVPGDGVTSNPSVSGTAFDHQSAVTNLRARLDGGAFGDVRTALSADGGFTLDAAQLQLLNGGQLLALGRHTLTLQAQDEHGNSSETSVDFTLDIRGPSISADLVSDTGGNTTDHVTRTAAAAGTVRAEGTLLGFQARLDSGDFVDIQDNLTPDGHFTLTQVELQDLFLQGASLADGQHTLTFRAEDEHQNVSETALTFTLDTRGPALSAALASDTGSSAGDRLTRDAAIRGSVSDAGSAVTLFQGRLDGGNAVNLLAQRGVAGSFSFTRPQLEQLFLGGDTLADGQHNLKLEARDEHGNASEMMLAFTLDTAGPALSAVLASDTGGSTSDRLTSTPTVSGAVTDQRSAVGALLARLDNGVFLAVTGDLEAGAFTLDAARLRQLNGGQVLADGPHTLTLQARDEHGNTTETTVAFTLDTTGPNLSATLASDTGASSSDHLTKVATISGTIADGGSAVTLFQGRLDGGTAVELLGQRDPDGNFTLTRAELQQLFLQGGTLADGTHSFTLQAQDEHGNASSTALAFTLDTTGPTLSAHLTSDTGNSSGDHRTRSADVSGQVADAHSALTSLRARLDGGAFGAVSSIDADGKFTLSAGQLQQLNSQPLTNGSHSLTLRAQDEHGNTTETTLDFTLDTTGPLLTAALGSDTGVSTTDHLTRTATISGKVLDQGSAVTFFQGQLDDGATVDLLGRRSADGTFSLNRADLKELFGEGKSLTDGQHTLTLQAQDEHGNATTTAVVFTLDTTGPTLQAALTGQSSTRSATISGNVIDSLSAVALFQGRLDGGTAVNLLDQLGTDGSFTLTQVEMQQLFLGSAPLKDGRHTLTLQTQDEHGNASETSVSFTLDVTGPDLRTALTGATGGVTNNPTIQGTAFDAGGTVTLQARLDGSSFTDVSTEVGPGGDFTLDAAQLRQIGGGKPLTDGLHTLLLRARDELGNTTDRVVAFTLDTTGPDLRAGLVNDTGRSASDGLTRTVEIGGSVADEHSTVTRFEGQLDGGGAVNLQARLDGDDFTLSQAEIQQLFLGGAALTEGTHALKLRAEDALGNASETSVTFTLDATAPALSAALASDTGASASDHLTSNPAVSGTAADQRSAVTALHARLDGGNYLDVSGDLNSGRFTLGVARLQQLNGGQPLADGAHTLTLQAQDEHGNTSETSVSFMLDATGPAVMAILASDTGSNASDRLTKTPEISGSVADTRSTVTQFQVQLDDGDIADLLSEISTNRDFRLDANRLQQLHGGHPLLDGTHTLIFRSRDEHGNSSETRLTFVLDTTAPTLSAALANDTGSPGDGLTAEPTFRGQVADANALTSLRAGLDGMGPNDLVDVTDALQPDGNFQLDRARLEAIRGGSLSEGAHTLHLQAQDAAGNSMPIDRTFTLKAVAPAGPHLTLSADTDTDTPGDFTTKYPVVTLTGVTDPGVEVVLQPRNLRTTADASGRFTFTGVALEVGDNTFTVRATDAAGNISTQTRIITRAAANLQIITATPLVGTDADGTHVTIKVEYDAKTAAGAAAPALTGLGLGLYFDPGVLGGPEVSNLFTLNRVEAGLRNDITNSDQDIATSQLYNTSWTSRAGTWPGSATPVELYTLDFRVAADFHGEVTVSFRGAPAAGYTLFAPPVKVVIP